MNTQETSEKLHNIIKQQELLQQQQVSLKAQEDALKKELASLEKVEADNRRQLLIEFVQNWIQDYIQNHDLNGYKLECIPSKMTIYYYNEDKSTTPVCESFKNDSLETISTKLEKLAQILKVYTIVDRYIDHIQQHLSDQFYLDEKPSVYYNHENEQFEIKFTIYGLETDIFRANSNTIDVIVTFTDNSVSLSITYTPTSYDKRQSIIRIDDHTTLTIESDGPYDTHDIYLRTKVYGSLNNFYPLLYQTISELDDRFSKIMEV